jgi:RNA polymerase sigma factor (sigma-70 family)
MRAKDPRALADFFEATFDRAHGLAFRLLGTPSAAEVAVQEIFVRIHRTTGKLNPTLDPELWVDAITYAVVEDLRRGKGRDLGPVEALSGPDTDKAAAEGEAGQRERIQRETRIQNVLMELSTAARDLLVLSQYHGLPLAEAAQVLGRREPSLVRELPHDLAELGRRLRAGKEDAPAGRCELEEWGRAALLGLSDTFSDPNLRDRIKRGFVLGHLTSTPKFFSPPRPRWVSVLRWGYIPTAAAGLLVLGFFMNRGPDWTVVHAAGTGSVEVDGEVVSLTDPDAGRDLRPQTRIELTSSGPLLLLCRGNLVLEVEPGTSLRLPSSPGRWIGNSSRGYLAAGRVRIATGPAFEGAYLDLETPHGVARLREGVVGLACKDATRLDVLEGIALFGTGSRRLEPVPAGRTALLSGEGSPAPGDLSAGEEAALDAFGGRARPLLEHTTEEGEGASRPPLSDRASR